MIIYKCVKCNLKVKIICFLFINCYFVLKLLQKTKEGAVTHRGNFDLEFFNIFISYYDDNECVFGPFL